MDVGSDPSIDSGGQHNAAYLDQSKEGVKQIKISPKNNMNLSKSQPSLNSNVPTSKQSWCNSKNRSLEYNAQSSQDRPNVREILPRSRSSGARYSRFREKYKQSNVGKGSNADVNKGEKPNHSIGRGSSETTGSDVDDLHLSDWGSEEAACDEEVSGHSASTFLLDEVSPICLSTFFLDKLNCPFCNIFFLQLCFLRLCHCLQKKDNEW